ncbi:hypothetical protein [Gulosibacter sp. 10]|uniref:YkvI family membrane protein n=1 Tax=Gulosibacter sp. 10 TaxID=1255570 RepID=UPI00097ED6A4|nr:hypothetical protein [Gulosibacter sp. 10]SJM71357.1 Membrane protein, putative [Gulosibacter sp. 10]
MANAPVTKSIRLVTKEKGSLLRIFTYAGAILAFLIGSGYATGQEIMQYFTSYGYWGIFGTGLLVLVLISFVSVEFFRVGHAKQYERPSEVFRYYGGKYLGTFFDYFSVLFVFLSYTVMVSGAGAVFEEQYGLSKYIGGVGLAVVVGLTVWFGLKNLVDIIGKIGPIIVIAAVALGVYGILRNPDGIAAGNALLPTLDVTQASSNWFLSGLSYVGFCMLWLAAFLVALGKNARNRAEASAGGVSGGVLFSISCMLVGLGLLANIGEVYDAQIPMLVMAGTIGPVIAAIISVMILAGIYTTAVPLLWTVSSRFFSDSSRKFKRMTLVLAALGTVVGLILPFDEMVNLVYVINGYVGIGLLVLMIIKVVWRIARRTPLEDPAVEAEPAAGQE